MKKLLLLLTAIVFISCAEQETSVVSNSKNRIKIKESVSTGAGVFLIIKVDSTEFITSSAGGFYKL